jgi:hypothetical protein
VAHPWRLTQQRVTIMNLAQSGGRIANRAASALGLALRHGTLPRLGSDDPREDRYGRLVAIEEVEYRVELFAQFDVNIFSSVSGPPGLDRKALEELVEQDWVWISADKNVLQESSWQLIRFEQITEL